MGVFNFRARVDYREQKKPKTANALLVGVIAGDSTNGRSSESAREVVQLFDVFKEANKAGKVTTFVKTLESGKLFKQGNVIDFLSIGIEGVVASKIVATAECHDLKVVRSIGYALAKGQTASASIPKGVDGTFSVVTLDFDKENGFVTARA